MKKLNLLLLIASVSFVSVANATDSSLNLINCAEEGACMKHKECKKEKVCKERKKEMKEKMKQEARESCKDAQDRKACMSDFKAKRKAELHAKKEEMSSEKK